MKTPIKLEFGRGGENESVTVHLEMLNCYSSITHELFERAIPIRNGLETIMRIRKEFKTLFAGTDADDFNKTKVSYLHVPVSSNASF